MMINSLHLLMKKRNSIIRSSISILILVSGIILSCGNPSGGKGNENPPPNPSLPMITSVRIFPDQPNKGSELSLFIQSQNPSGDPISYHYQWIKNDEEVPGENTNILKSGNYVKGDLIRVRVTPSCENANGEPFLSDPIKVMNMPPVIEEIHIEPKIVYAGNELKAFVKGFDPDGDSVHYLYRWEVNGTVMPDENTDLLKTNPLKKGDSIEVTVTPHDGETSGKPKKSEPILIANAPPLIVSSPPSQVNGNIYTYQVEVEDQDHGPIVYVLKSAPKGMEINKETGLIRWEIQKGNTGTYPIEIEVSAKDGAKSFQRYSLRVLSQ